MKKNNILNSNKGFSLMELIVVIIIIGVLSAVGVRSIMKGNENARVQETMQEMEALKKAVIGDPDLVANGVRTDFGFVGDCGAWPTSPQDLITNPGYPFWNGPYISTGFQENPNDFIQDAWGNPYSFTQTTIQSSGGGGGTLTKTIVSNLNDALNNAIIGNLTDWNGSTPKSDDLVNFQIWVSLQSGSVLSIPSGNVTISAGGVYTVSGVHIGNHMVIGYYSGVANVDTVKKFVSVGLKSAPRADLRFNTTFYGTGEGGGSGPGGSQSDNLVVSGDNTINQSYYANGIRLGNSSDSDDVRIEEITVIWSSAASDERYSQIDIDGTTVWTGGWLGQQSGTTAVLTNPFTISPGQNDLVLEIWWSSSFFTSDPQGKMLELAFRLGDGSLKYYPE